jgi:MFS family permease
MAGNRSIRWRFYAYKASRSMGPYLPVHVLYLLDQGYGVAFIALMQAVFSVVLLVTELPLGYVADRLGRRWALVAGGLFRVAGVLGYVVAAGPVQYLFLKVLTGISWALASGTEDAWLYRVLAVHDDPDAYVAVASRGRTALLLVSALGAIAGGVLYTIAPATPFLLTAGLGLLSVPLLLSFPGTGGAAVADATDSALDSPDGGAPGGLSVGEALGVLRGQFRRPPIRWIAAYSILLFLIFDLSRTFEQPAMDAVGLSVTGIGFLYAGFKFVSAGAAAATNWVTERLGVKRTLALGAPVLGVTYATAAVIPIAIVPILFLYRGTRSILVPVRNEYLNRRLPERGRATVLSGISMALSLSGAVARLAGGQAAGIIGPVDFLALAGVSLAMCAGGLWLVVSRVHPLERPAAQVTPSDD